ncbi:MAG: ATP-binding protein [Candidatus Brocadiia bacterium]
MTPETINIQPPDDQKPKTQEVSTDELKITSTVFYIIHGLGKNILRFTVWERIVLTVGFLVLLPLTMIMLIFVSESTDSLVDWTNAELENAAQNAVASFAREVEAFAALSDSLAAERPLNEDRLRQCLRTTPCFVGAQYETSAGKGAIFRTDAYANLPPLAPGSLNDPVTGDRWLVFSSNSGSNKVVTVFDISLFLSQVSKGFSGAKYLRFSIGRDYVMCDQWASTRGEVGYLMTPPAFFRNAFMLPRRAFPESEPVFVSAFRYFPHGGETLWLRSFAGISSGEISDGIVAFRSKAGSLVLITFILTMLLAVSAAGILIRPIRKLSEAVRVKCVENVMEAKAIPYEWEDEVGDLTSAINKLSLDLKSAFTNLESNRLQLEQKVEERTAELNAALAKINEYTKNLEVLVAAQSNQIVEVQRRAILATLVHGLTHNLKNPLSSILGYLQLLADGYEERERRLAKQPETIQKVEMIAMAEERNWIDLMIEGVERSIEIVNNILDRASASEQAKIVSININKMLRRELVFLESDLFFKHQVAKEIELEPDLPDFTGSYSDLSQIFENLLQNAREAMQDSIEKTLTLRTRLENGFIFIDVKDSGDGIAPENLPNLFKPYFSTKRDKGMLGGSGLGLSSSMDIVKKYGGDIYVSSAVGRGTTFTVKLPVKR